MLGIAANSLRQTQRKQQASRRNSNENHLRSVYITVVEGERALDEGGVGGARLDGQAHDDVVRAGLDDWPLAELRRRAGQSVRDEAGRSVNLIIENTTIGATVREER